MKDVKTSLGHPRYTHRLARIIKMPSVSHYLNANLPWCTLSLMPHYRCVPEQRRVDSLPISLACFMLSFAKGDEADIYIRPWCDNTTCVDSVTPRFKTWWSLDIQANKNMWSMSHSDVECLQIWSSWHLWAHWQQLYILWNNMGPGVLPWLRCW